MSEAIHKRPALSESDESGISATQVADYLLHHPEFFQDQEHLLADLILPHSRSGAVSLVERQAAVMRERNSELRQRLGMLIATARENDQIFRLTKKLGLALLEANSLDDVARVIRHCMLQDFHLDGVNLMLFDQPQLNSNDLYTETASDAAKRVLGKLLRGERVICAAMREEEVGYLFPHFEPRSGSAAIIPLIYEGELGLLAIGRHDPQHFGPAMDTTFVSYIGQIVSRRVRAFLPNPFAQPKLPEPGTS
jgi:uncharacterized protein YigA (DUF484 family)